MAHWYHHEGQPPLYNGGQNQLARGDVNSRVSHLLDICKALIDMHVNRLVRSCCSKLGNISVSQSSYVGLIGCDFRSTVAAVAAQPLLVATVANRKNEPTVKA